MPAQPFSGHGAHAEGRRRAKEGRVRLADEDVRDVVGRQARVEREQLRFGARGEDDGVRVGRNVPVDALACGVRELGSERPEPYVVANDDVVVEGLSGEREVFSSGLESP